MAKLYWRVKLNGKWTWRSAIVCGTNQKTTHVYNCEEEEE